MVSRKDALRTRILADHAASIAILQGLTPKQWEQPVPSETDAPWKARDVLAHLAVSEGGQLHQINKCLAGEPPVPDDFDLTRFNRRSVQKQVEKSPEELLKEIETGHANVLARLEEVGEEEFDKKGRHARGDVLTVEQFFIRVTEHRRQHAEELQKEVGSQP